MQHEIPEHKICPRCDTDKPSDEFYVNSSRVDGLTYYCKECVKAYAREPRKEKQQRATNKTCDNCVRTLPLAAFKYAQHETDKLRPNCRTCESFRVGFPTVDQVVAHEAKMKQIYREATTEQPNYKTQRSQFEELVYKKMLKAGLLKKWKPPVWMHKTSIPD